ncbi:ATP-binding protein [Myroides odoratimimus]|uniref:ATP-binding protein n=1 Tax=Myroides odoratimimus TaxID=76832 RepID=UPI002DBC1051|nr:ATP-binding protein [Myroides odoratimimus]MEC4053235.1 ATP-binding protein [Myroides odoratimimus]
MSNKLEFKVSSAIKNIVGRDLIVNDNVAIFELVKNSYDAKAKNVIIDFKSDSITIKDNGKGMTLDDIKNKWLFLAYSAKKDNSEDNDIDEYFNDIKKERQHFAGAKGVGRFSADRVGRFLKMTTKTIDSDTCEVISLDWTLFDKNQSDTFTSISVEHNKEEFNNQFPESFTHGTIIEIEGLHKLWTRSELLILRRFLEKLTNPFQKTNSFSIEVKCEREQLVDDELLDKEDNEQSIVNGRIENTVLEVLSLKTTRIDQYIKEGFIYTEITDRGTLMYKIKERNKYKLLNDFKVSILFLNQSARNIFTRRMGVKSVQYGSLFLYKNDMRILPYGDYGDDSWGLDRRKQQGHGRYLGTRDIFGQISIQTENHEEFKETSSRDGGLIDTDGSKEIMELFKDASRKLERYVVGVLWGERFLKENYFIDKNDVVRYRDALRNDKLNLDNSLIAQNIGSKVDYTQIIKNLAQDENITILDYNRDMTQFILDEINIVNVDLLEDLEKIALKTEDDELTVEVGKIRKEIVEERRKTIEAEKRAIEAEKEREKAEKEKIEAEKKAKEAEEKAKKAEEQKKKAELEKIKAELNREAEKQKRKQAELDKKEAELKRIEAERNAKLQEQKSKDLEGKLNIEEKKNQYLNATRKTLSDDAEQLVHSIDLYVGNAATSINRLLVSNLGKELQNQIYAIKSNLDKALKVSNIIIKTNFDYKHTKQRVNLPKYIKEYLEDIAVSRPNLEIEVKKVFDKYYFINPIELDIILDNLVSNSVKAKATKVLVNFESKDDKVVFKYYDNGIGLDINLINNPSSIFELGVRESSEPGSGIGLFDVKKRVINLNGDITFIGNNLELKGAAFKLVL